MRAAAANGPQWIEIGHAVSFDLESGESLRLHPAWCLVTPSAGGELGGKLQIARRECAADAPDMGTDAHAAVVAWRWGDEPTGGAIVTTWDCPQPKGSRRIAGRCVAVYYTTVREGEALDYVHKFSRPGPRLVYVDDDNGARLEGGAAYVTERGIIH